MPTAPWPSSAPAASASTRSAGSAPAVGRSSMSPDPTPAVRVAVLASGRGSNLGAIARAIDEGRVPARLAVVIADRADAGALAIARAHGIEAVVLSPTEHP